MNILARLPKMKTSTDFNSALADLEREKAAAATAVADLEARRESAIFAGENLDKMEGEIIGAEHRVRTLGVALEGARKRRDAAIEAERQTGLEKIGKAASKLNGELRKRLVNFATSAQELATHADAIERLRREIASLNSALRDGERADLVARDPVHEAVEAAGRQVRDPLSNLNVAESYPPHPTGPALALLK